MVCKRVLVSGWVVLGLVTGLAVGVGCGDDDPATGTDTATDTATAEDTATGTDTATVEDTATGTDTATAEDTDTATAEDTATGTDTATAEDTATPEDTVAPTGAPFDGPHAVFAAKCGSCHTGGGSGGHNMGASDIDTAYADSQKNSEACSGLTMGACALVRVKAGEMPRLATCTGDPEQDSGKPACLTQAEQDILELWIDDGQLPPLH